MFLFPISPVKWSIKNISKPLSHLIRHSIKITESDNVKFLKCIVYNDGVFLNFVRFTVTVRLNKNEFSKTVNLRILFFSQ